MKSAVLFTLILALILFPVFFTGFPAGEGWFWALGNGFGFVALAGLLYLSMDARNGAKLKRHKKFSYVVFGLIVAHGHWFLIGDPVTLEYLKPGAPAYMWSGVLGFFLMGFLLFSSTDSNRPEQFLSANSFRVWHKLLAIGVVVSSIYHILGSSFYLNQYWQWTLLSAMAITVFLISGRRWFRDSRTSVLTILSLFGTVAFVVFRGFV